MTDVAPRLARGRLRAAIQACADAGMSLDEVRQETERDFLEVVFNIHRGMHGKVAAAIGVHRNTLTRRFRELGLRTVYGRKRTLAR